MACIVCAYKMGLTTDQISNLKVVNRETLIAKRVLSKNSKALIKIIAGKKELKAPIEVSVNYVTAGANKMITSAKGKVTIVK